MSEISIVIVSLVGGEALLSYLDTLKAVADRCLVLVDSDKNKIVDLRQKFSSMHFIEKDALSVPMARKLGVEQAKGDVVALLEDTSLPSTEWYDSITTAFNNAKVVAVGGPVTLSPGLGGRFLALGCGEYGRFHPGRYVQMNDGEAIDNGLIQVTRLPGNNLAYRREVLLNILNAKPHGLIEGEVNEQLKADGEKLYMHPSMLVSYSFLDEHGARLKTRFNHGRLFAGNRISGQSWKTRMMWLLKSILLPVVLSLRSWSSMTRAVDYMLWPKVMIWIALMETAWALGEVVGYVSGAGKSMEAWH